MRRIDPDDPAEDVDTAVAEALERDAQLLRAEGATETPLTRGLSHRHRPLSDVCHPHMAQLESLNYEITESVVYKADQASRAPNEHITYSAVKWAMCLILGISTAFLAWLCNVSVENIAASKFVLAHKAMHKSKFAGYLVYCSINALLLLLGASITVLYAPAAAGSGIPEVKAFLNGVDIPGIFHFRTLVAKFVGATCVVAGSMPLGKEGPFVHIGAAVAALLNDGGDSWRVLKVLKNDRDLRDLVTCGVGGGVAGAFRSPIGGMLFALEEMSSQWKAQLLWRCFFTCAVVVFSARSFMRWCDNGGCGFSRGAFIIYEIKNGQSDFFFAELFPVVLVGLIGGLVGAIFSKINEEINRWRRDVLQPKYGPKGRILEVLFASLAVSTISFAAPLAWGCRPCPPGSEGRCPGEDIGRFVSMGCDRDSYSDLAMLLFNPQDEAIRNLYTANTDRVYRFSTLLLFFGLYFASFAYCFGMGIPAGSLVPSVLGGAAFGRIVGMFMTRTKRGSEYFDESTYALLGSAAMLSGMMRSTASVCVIILEISNNLNTLPMIMLTILVAKATADSTGIEALFDMLTRLKRLPFLEGHSERFYRHLSAADVASQPVVGFKRIMKVKDIMAVLSASRHNGFPVHNQSGTFIGVILRSDLTMLLRTGRALQGGPDFDPEALLRAYEYDVSDFTVAAREEERLSAPRLSPSQLELYLDLGPYVNPAPYVVQADTSLSKVYHMFHHLNLRHLCVVPHVNEVIGVITRKDLHPEMVERRLPRGGRGANGIEESTRGRQDVRRKLNIHSLLETGEGERTPLGGLEDRDNSTGQPSRTGVYGRAPSTYQSGNGSVGVREVPLADLNFSPGRTGRGVGGSGDGGGDEERVEGGVEVGAVTPPRVTMLPVSVPAPGTEAVGAVGAGRAAQARRR